MEIKAIFFDLDDTLHDHQKPFADSLRTIFTNFNNEISIDSVYKKFRYYSDLLWEDYLRKEMTLEEMRVQRMIATMNCYGYKISEEESRRFQLQYETAITKTELFPEVPELLTTLLQSGFELGMITNGPTMHQMNKIKTLGLTKYIPLERIFISEKVGVSKPDPSIFQIAAEQFHYHPENLLYIGDSWVNDVVGSQKAGWNTIWFNHRQRQPETDHKPLMEITGLFSILDALMECGK